MPYQYVPMQIIDGKDYTGAPPRAASAMLPASAGVYVWTLQLSRALDSIGGGGELPTLLGGRFKQLRENYSDNGYAGKYRRVQIFDDPPVLKKTSADRAQALLANGHTDFSWLLAVGTVFQRPLYIGKAINFRTRLPQHFKYKTPFGQELKKFGLTFNDLAVTLLILSDEGVTEDVDAVDEQDLAESVASDAAEVPEDQEYGDDEVVPAERGDQDKMIRLAESLLIRNLHPIFNKQVE